MESNERSGRPSTCRNDVIVEEVKTLIMANCRLTVREIGDKLGISKDSGHAILTQDLGFCKIYPQIAFQGAETSSSWHCSGFVANYRWQSRIPEHCDNWRWKLGVRNESSVFAVETSIIGKTQKKHDRRDPRPKWCRLSFLTACCGWLRLVLTLIGYLTIVFSTV